MPMGVKNYRGFIEQYFAVLDAKTQVPIPFKLNPVQAKYYEIIQTEHPNMEGIRDIVLKARQEGMSSFVLALFTVDFLMMPYSVSICISHRKDSTDLLFKKVKFYIDSYCQKAGIDPKSILKTDNKNTIENAQNNAVFYIGTAGAKVGGRGGSARNILFSECAFFQDTELITAQEIVLGTAQQVPQGRGMIFIESTANGLGNYYQKTWEQASRGESAYKPRFFGWEEFYPKAWIEEKRKEFPNEAMFMQEYPRCVTGETRFSSKRTGIIKFSEVEGAEVGISETLTLKTEHGRTISTTPNHLFMTPSGEWERMVNLQTGDKISLLPPVFSESYQNISLDLGLPVLKKVLKIDEDLALFLGFYMGDGSLHKGKKGSGYTLSIVFDAKDVKSIETCERLLVKLFGRFTKRVVGNKKGGVELRVSSKYLGEFADSLGLIYRNDKGKGNIKRLVHVPDFILKSPKSVIKNFLQGLFDADGFSAYNSPRIVFFSKHEEFIRDIQLLLLGFGATSKINITTKKAGDGHLYTGRELVLRKLETEKFMKEIGFVSERKNDRWNNRIIKTKNQQNVLPILFEDTVKTVEKGIKQMVYDKEIIPEHYYSANGIYVHNSPEEAFISTGTPYFDNQILAAMHKAAPEPILQGKFAPDGTLDILTPTNKEGYSPVRIYREPEPNEQFVVFADPADAKDYCAAVACSKKRYDFPIVMNEIMESAQFGYELFYMCKYIFDKTGIWPKLAVERNTGQATIYVLNTMNYPDLFRMIDFASTNPHEGGGIGWVTTGHLSGGELQGTRRKMLDDLSLAIKQSGTTSGYVSFYDKTQIEQMQSFMIVKGRAQAKSNKKDDLVMASAGAWQVQLLTPSVDFGGYDADAVAAQREKWRFK